MTQEELGFGASLHRTEIGLLERGERVPRLDTAVKLTKTLGVTLPDLAAGVDWEPSTSSVGRFSVEPGPD